MRVRLYSGLGEAPWPYALAKRQSEDASPTAPDPRFHRSSLKIANDQRNRLTRTEITVLKTDASKVGRSSKSSSVVTFSRQSLII